MKIEYVTEEKEEKKLTVWDLEPGDVFKLKGEGFKQVYLYMDINNIVNFHTNRNEG